MQLSCCPPTQFALAYIFSAFSASLTSANVRTRVTTDRGQAGFLGNAGEWAHDMHNLTSNGTGLAGMVARLLYSGALPDDRYVHIRKPTEKREWLLASALPLGTPKPDNWQIGVVDSGSARSQASYAR